MTFNEWRDENPCEHEGSAGDCWNCNCAHRAWKHFAPLVKAASWVVKDSPHYIGSAAAIDKLERALKAMKDG